MNRHNHSGYKSATSVSDPDDNNKTESNWTKFRLNIWASGAGWLRNGILQGCKIQKIAWSDFTRNIHVARLTAAKAVQNGNPTVLWTAERRSRRDFLRMPKNTKTSGTLFTRNIRVARLTAANAVQNGNPTVFWTAMG
ncbi:hypothetical protein [Rheinheimera tilapiae]|uniref:Uncharacterized protein n=1 Tax=Rheinheimera tilapiae TaxID=875043 RepID=A0ABV6B9T8_9GAMM